MEWPGTDHEGTPGMTVRTYVALVGWVVLPALLVLGGCGTGATPGGGTSTKSPECQKAKADIEKLTHYDSKTNPSPTVSQQTALEVSRIIVEHPSCYDSDLVKQARGALHLTPTTSTTTTGGS
jgi:hypothetical protein